MKRFSRMLRPASPCLAFLAVILSACGGGGGSGGGVSHGTLTGLSVAGPSSVNEYETGAFTATGS